MSYLRSCESYSLGSLRWTLHPEMLRSPRFGSFMLQLPSNHNRAQHPLTNQRRAVSMLIGGGKYGPTNSLDSVSCLAWPDRNRTELLRTRLAGACHFSSAILLPSDMAVSATIRRDIAGMGADVRDNGVARRGAGWGLVVAISWWMMIYI